MLHEHLENVCCNCCFTRHCDYDAINNTLGTLGRFSQTGAFGPKMHISVGFSVKLENCSSGFNENLSNCVFEGHLQVLFIRSSRKNRKLCPRLLSLKLSVSTTTTTTTKEFQKTVHRFIPKWANWTKHNWAFRHTKYIKRTTELTVGTVYFDNMSLC